MTLFLNATSVDTIAIFMPVNNVKFSLPITLSSGTGRNEFINIEQPQVNVVVRQSINRKICRYTRPAMINGTITLHPQSTALSAIRQITEYQNNTGISVNGTFFILNIQAAQFDKYSDFSFTSVYQSANRNKTLGDVQIQFSSLPPTAISLAVATTLFNTLSGIGI